ncbi:hypothetical protein SeMB42_g03758 [Synchytrium endobioticum]|uniref:Acetylornithine transaminase n=1 Tax=Synchytrium endobioticum TaxID=286115 RepID=A0A507CUZ1_9FUNG|nr:hypothetical protein SeLEV6574_g05330 [Synchytrium endobioticum]TPX46312.1 hypothetical protein SeMB42_g03758 [Synchytrium endobioticum]
MKRALHSYRCLLLQPYRRVIASPSCNQGTIQPGRRLISATLNPEASTSTTSSDGHANGGIPPPTHLDADTHADTMSRIQQDNQYLLQMYPRPNLIFTHGTGCLLYDLGGRPYLDLNSGIAVSALGHGDAHLQAVIADQATKLIHLSNLYHNEYAGALARMLVEALGNRGKWAATSENGGTRVFLCNSGTEANEGAMKFARKWGKQAHQKAKEGKHDIISFSHAFHGRSFGSLSATPNSKYQSPFTPLMPGFTSIPFNDIEKAMSTINEKTCAVLVEPIQGEGGVIPASQEFLSALREKCDDVGALLIFDEVQCGLAKPLANGIPAGAILVSPRVASILKPGDHGTTFGGSPFASRVAIDVLKRINNPAFLQHVSETGKYFKSKLQEIADSTPLIKEVRGRGLLIGVQLRDGVDANMFVDEARERGILLITAGNNTIRIVPPLIITSKEVDQAVNVIEDVVSELETQYASGRV